MEKNLWTLQPAPLKGVVSKIGSHFLQSHIPKIYSHVYLGFIIGLLVQEVIDRQLETPLCPDWLDVIGPHVNQFSEPGVLKRFFPYDKIFLL